VDFVLHAINVIDLKDFRLEQRHWLPFPVRPIAVDPERGILMLGESVNAALHIYRLSDFEEIPIEPTPFGRYGRFFGYDQARGRLFTASSCGVYQINIDALLPHTQ
jgi:hypothetical protein